MERRFPYHLCQPDDLKSCAACCGIYNFRQNGRNDIERRLLENTESIGQIKGYGLSVEKLREYSETVRWHHNSSGKLFQTIFNCEFTGFLDEEGQKIGCLLHPAHNDGKDWRDCGFYGKELCNGHYCLSYFYLTSVEQKLVIDTTDDWYLYGLTITDIDLVKGVFSILSDLVGETLNLYVISQNDELKSIINSIWLMKLSWPYRTKDENSFGKYIFRGEDYEQIYIPYETFHKKRSPYHSIFLSFGSEFKNAKELESAEKILSATFRLFAKIYNRTKAWLM